MNIESEIARAGAERQYERLACARLAMLRDCARGDAREKRRRLACAHPILFGLTYMPEWLSNEGGALPCPSPLFHWEMARAAMTETRSAFAAPRGFGKTMIMTKLLPLWSAFSEEKANEIVLVSASGAMAEGFLNQVRLKVEESALLQEDWGDVRGVMWGSTDLEIVLKQGTQKRHVFLLARGRGAQVRGLRPWRGIVDDLDSEETVDSEKMCADLEEWFWGALVNIFDTPEKKLVCIGTAFNAQSLIAKLIAHPRPGWFVKSFAALEGERSMWEERWPTAHLLDRRREIGVARFAADFQNAPVGRRGHYFTHKHIVVQNADPQEQGFVTMTVDPAVSGKGDPWAIVVVKQVKDRAWYVEEAMRRQADLAALLDAIFAVYKRWRPSVVGIEASAFQRSLQYIIPEQERMRGMRLPMRYLAHARNKGSKHERIMELHPLFEAGRIKVRTDQTAMKNEILQYPYGPDDLMDALAMQLEVQRAHFPDPLPEAARRGPTMAERRERLDRYTVKRPTAFDRYSPYAA